MIHSLRQLFEHITGKEAAQQITITASGSNRKYYRLISEDEKISLIGVVGTSLDENNAFLYMIEHFTKCGLNVPKLVGVSDDRMCYLQEDLGDTLLFDFIADGRKTGVFCLEEKEMLSKTITALARFQIQGAKDFDFSYCYPQPEFNERSIRWDLNYFKYCFLKATELDFQENLLENDFEKLTNILLKAPNNAFMYRDFQSRNVMITEKGEPYFIDFQGGRKGPVYYDVASFLWQAKANFHQELRAELIAEYIDELEKYTYVDRAEFYQTLQHFVIFRIMQVLGAYGFRGYFEKKPHFLQSIPFALKNLKQCLAKDMKEYPYLAETLLRLTKMKQFNESSNIKPLVVRIYSFAYKKGIPQDESGNGGGFVFDCRGINNPGKYTKYAHFTGLDEPVIDFMESNKEVFPFLQATYKLVDPTIKRYIDRGFQSLMICFGCTGGKHRSVYLAEKMASHVSERFGVEVQLVHREQDIAKEFPAKSQE